jgi:hypothetical protein
MKWKLLAVAVVVTLVAVGLGGYAWVFGSYHPPNEAFEEITAPDPLIVDMIQQVDEGEIYGTVFALQNFTSRHYWYPGNQQAAAYIHDRLSSIPGLDVEYQGEVRNVIATLPGRDAGSDEIYLVGAHYDSTSEPNKDDAPGATDNGGGVAIVLELARIMSQYEFDHTIRFALWNTEEGGGFGGEYPSGSGTYANDALIHRQNIKLYVNFDSSCYDPDDRMVLDVMTNERSRWASDMMTDHNRLYSIGFNLTYNVHTCGSDHQTFWGRGYAAVMTHSETHGPSHSPQDTIDKISPIYAKKNGQLGMSVLARLAGAGLRR